MFNPAKMEGGAAASAVIAVADVSSSASPPTPPMIEIPPTEASALGDRKPNAEPVRLVPPPVRSVAVAAAAVLSLPTVVAPDADADDAPMEDCKNEKPLLEDGAATGAGDDADFSLDWPLTDRPPNMVVVVVYYSMVYRIDTDMVECCCSHFLCVGLWWTNSARISSPWRY